MQKIKPLLPTLKEKKRYLVYKVISKKPLNRDISTDILNNVRNKLGVFDSADAGLINVEYDIKKQSGILRTSHKSLDKVRAAMAMIPDYLIQVVGVSGILKKARNY